MRERLLTIFVALLIAGVGAGFYRYRAEKLALLEPGRRPPLPVLGWTGQGPCRLLMIGDSRIARWPVRAVPGWIIAKAGFPGESALAIARVAPAIVAQARPNLLLVQAGGNDAVAASFLTTARRSRVRKQTHTALLAMAAAAPNGLVMTVVPPIKLDPARRLLLGHRSEHFVWRLNAALRKDGPPLLDADKLLRDRNGRLDPAYRLDAHHWTAAGYARIEMALAPALAKGCVTPSSRDTSP